MLAIPHNKEYSKYNMIHELYRNGNQNLQNTEVGLKFFFPKSAKKEEVVGSKILGAKVSKLLSKCDGPNDHHQSL